MYTFSFVLHLTVFVLYCIILMYMNFMGICVFVSNCALSHYNTVAEEIGINLHYTTCVITVGL